MTNIQKNLASNMRSLRSGLGMSQAALGKKCGSSGNYIAQIERGERFPSPSMIERIADSLDVDSTELFAKTFPVPSNPWNWTK